VAGTGKASQPTTPPWQTFYSFCAGSLNTWTAWYPPSGDSYSTSGTALGSFRYAPRTGKLRVYRAAIEAVALADKTAYCRLYNKSTGQQIYQISMVGTGGWQVKKEQGDALALVDVSIGDEIFAQIRASEAYGVVQYLFGIFTVGLV